MNIGSEVELSNGARGYVIELGQCAIHVVWKSDLGFERRWWFDLWTGKPHEVERMTTPDVHLVTPGMEPALNIRADAGALPATCVGTLLRDSAALYDERRAVYGPSELVYGRVMSALFPDGVAIKTEDGWARYGLLNMIVSKLTRYCANPEKGHADSARDSAVYWAMLADLDAKLSGKENGS